MRFQNFGGRGKNQLISCRLSVTKERERDRENCTTFPAGCSSRSQQDTMDVDEKEPMAPEASAADENAAVAENAADRDRSPADRKR